MVQLSIAGPTPFESVTTMPIERRVFGDPFLIVAPLTVTFEIVGQPPRNVNPKPP